LLANFPAVHAEFQRSFNAVPIVIGVSGRSEEPGEAEPILRDRFGEILRRFASEHALSPLLVLYAPGSRSGALAADEAARLGVPVMATPDVDDAEAFIAYYSAALVVFGSASRANAVDAGAIFEIDRSGVREIYPERHGLAFDQKKKKKFAWRKTTAKAVEPAKAEFEAALRNLDRFNCDIEQEPAPEVGDPLEVLQRRADGASNRLQKWTLHSLTGLYVVAAIAGSVQLVVQQPLTELWGGALNAAGTGVRVGVLALAFIWFKFAKHKDYENRYQDYRAIAEALRVQHAWCSAGMRDRLVENSYLQMQQSELQWIRLALRTIYLISDARTPKPTDSPNCKECSAWIDDQLKYYESAAQRQAGKQRDATRTAGILAGIGGAISGLAVILLLLNNGVSLGGRLAFMGIHAQHWSLYSEWPQLQNAQKSIAQWATYLITVPPTLAGMFALLTGFYTQQRGFTENSRRYQRVFAVFDMARRRLHDATDDPRVVLGDLGHEALSEHADWLILHRERPLRVVSAPITMQGVHQ
jgi:hypothetical protein